MKTAKNSRLGRKLIWLALITTAVLILTPLIAINATARPTRLASASTITGNLDPDAFEKGVAAYYAGDHETALVLLAQVSESHPQYAKAMRFIGWGIYANELGRPEDGVAYVNLSLRADPWDGNVWQDLSRTYGNRLLGMIGLGKPRKPR